MYEGLVQVPPTTKSAWARYGKAVVFDDFGGIMCLDVSDAGNGALVRLAACSAGRKADQGFALKPSYDLVDVAPDLCVDVKDKATAAGTVLQTWTCGRTSSQKWRIP